MSDFERVLLSNCEHSNNGQFRVHLTEADWEKVQRERAEAQAKVAKLREALALAEVEVYLAKTWCRVCRTEGLGALRSREAHPHARECLLYREP